MNYLLHSFNAKLTAIFLVLMLILGVTLAFLSVRAALQFELETEQKLNRTLAQDLAKEFQPYLNDMIDEVMIQEKIQYLMGINRRIEIYLMGSEGMIKAHFVPNNEDIVRRFIDTAPLDQYLQGADLPLLGEDPLHERQMKPFTVAPISIMGEEGCYLYVILGGERYYSSAAMIRDSYIMRTTLYGVGLTILLTGVVGMLSFAMLTKRLRRMKDVVTAFEKGKRDRRIEPGMADEIGQLAVSFNQMADTIVANMEELKRTDRLRRELIANISHDLRSPLASIQGYLETVLMKEHSLDPDERRRYMEVGLKNTQRLNKLVGELFELSKLDAQQIQPQIEAFSIAELVQDLAMQFMPQADRQGVAIEVEQPESLALVYADIALVERAISNLIDNALQYTPRGGTVRIVPTNDRDQVCVRIIDTGYGIPPEDLEHVFERFYRVEKSRGQDKKGGAGLGLAIAKKIMELHGSTLSVQSVVNKGTTFTFALPTRHARSKKLQLA